MSQLRPKPSSPSPSSPSPSSPCTKLCILDAVTSLCEGCGRTRDEIALWGSMSEAQRRAVMGGLEGRLRAAYPRRAPAPAES
ncbi:DUF1289 domain-containing protein [Methylobacterium sp. J-068]|uniref:DUF1289 domain-containing protein n=1 Tax=Methylobacterium sp. J-068 TaxID=2836649 RepID=UPI001FBA5C45|nr:DUF1289 domain-containing protein [Methylobacterium sp. J-068]MCJ2033926.1 DUF1289 domain-containing protein [Methylobacterium sp. J-068]